jgi:hypothetical protein
MPDSEAGASHTAAAKPELAVGSDCSAIQATFVSSLVAAPCRTALNVLKRSRPADGTALTALGAFDRSTGRQGGPPIGVQPCRLQPAKLNVLRLRSTRRLT